MKRATTQALPRMVASLLTLEALWLWVYQGGPVFTRLAGVAFLVEATIGLARPNAP